MRKFFRILGSSGGVFGEFFSMLWREKLWWLTPMVVVLIGLAVLMVVAGPSGVGPFLYTLF